MQSLADIIMGTVQYNEEGVLMSIHEVCDVMTNGSGLREKRVEPYSRLITLAQVWKGLKICVSYLLKPQDVTIEPFLLLPWKGWAYGLVVPPRGSL